MDKWRVSCYMYFNLTFAFVHIETARICSLNVQSGSVCTTCKIRRRINVRKTPDKIRVSLVSLFSLTKDVTFRRHYQGLCHLVAQLSRNGVNRYAEFAAVLIASAGQGIIGRWKLKRTREAFNHRRLVLSLWILSSDGGSIREQIVVTRGQRCGWRFIKGVSSWIFIEEGS